MKRLRGLWKDQFYGYLVGEGSHIYLGEPQTMTEYSAGNYTLVFDDPPLGTYELTVGVGDNVHRRYENYWYWAKAEDKITIEFEDDFEDTDFSYGAWVENNGEWHIYTNSNNFLWTTSPAADGYDPIIQLKGTSNWTDYTVETDFGFIDTGSEGAAAYIIGRDSILLGESHPYGGLYIVSAIRDRYLEYPGRYRVGRE